MSLVVYYRWQATTSLLPTLEEGASYKVERVLLHEDRGSRSRPNEVRLIKLLGCTLEHSSWESKSNLSVEFLQGYWNAIANSEDVLTHHGLRMTTKLQLRINVWDERCFKGGHFFVLSYLHNIMWARDYYEFVVPCKWHEAWVHPMAWLNHLVFLTIVLMHYILGFAGHECGHSFLSGEVCHVYLFVGYLCYHLFQLDFTIHKTRRLTGWNYDVTLCSHLINNDHWLRALNSPKGMEGEPLTTEQLRGASTLSSYKYIRLKVGWIVPLTIPLYFWGILQYLRLLVIVEM
jgi:hypothetical protein